MAMVMVRSPYVSFRVQASSETVTVTDQAKKDQALAPKSALIASSIAVRRASIADFRCVQIGAALCKRGHFIAQKGDAPKGENVSEPTIASRSAVASPMRGEVLVTSAGLRFIMSFPSLFRMR
jgi:hypothetical protein